MKYSSFLCNTILLLLLSLHTSPLFSQQWKIAKHAGGLHDDSGWSIALDGAKNVYMGGEYSHVAYFDTDTLPCNGMSDYFLAKYTPNGDLNWVVSGGGNGDWWDQSIDRVSDIKINTKGDIFITGTFNNTASFGGFTMTAGFWPDCFVARYDTNGNCIWVRKIGGIDYEYGDKLVLDNQDNLYVIGTSSSTEILASSTHLNIGEHAFFIAKYNSDGDVKWIKSIEGEGSMWASDVHYMNNTLFLVGAYTGNINFDTVFISTQKEYLPVIFKLNTSGACIWGKSFDCENFGYLTSVDVSDFGYIYCSGENNGTMIVGNDTIRDSGGFIIKYDSLGNSCWLRKLGYSAKLVAINHQNQIIVCGGCKGIQQLSNCELLPSTDNSQSFIVKLNCKGECLGSIRIQNPAFYADIIDNEDRLFLAGSSEDTKFGTISMGTNGEDDAFWAKLDLSDFEETKGNGANNLMIYSNPNNGIFNVDVPLEAMNEKQLTLKIFDNSNRLVKQENLDMTEEAFNVEVPEYKPGIYFLQLISKKRTYTGKMIVQ